MRDTADTITCPSCSELIPVTEALAHRAREKAERELKASKAALAEREREAAAELAKQKLALEGRAAELAQAQAAVAAQVDEQVAAQVQAQRASIETAAHAAAAKAQDVARAHLQAQLAQETAHKEQAQQEALAGLELKRTYEAKAKELDLRIAREVESSRAQIAEEAARIATEHAQRKAREKDQQIETMRRQVDELKRKAEQGSQQTQGEAFEVSLEDSLRAAFPMDAIAGVAKGVKGADLVHTVRSAHGRDCGTIVWELKVTKAWSGKWLGKLKDDQRALKAELAVIVSATRPDDVELIAERQGVWICAPRAAIGVAAMLRTGLIQVSTARAVEEGKAGKAEVLFAYLTSPAFQQRLEAVVEAFEQMRTDLDKERRAITAAWAKREQQIQRALEGAAGLYGDMQGLLGSQMPAIEQLELPGLELDAERDADRDAAGEADNGAAGDH